MTKPHPERANVQGQGFRNGLGQSPDYKPAGTIAWAEHEEAWRAYAKRYGRDQSALVIHERWGFDYGELVLFLGREPTTWAPR